MSFSNLRISAKLALGFAAVVLTIIAMSGAIYWNLQTTKVYQTQRVTVNQILENVRLAEFRMARQENSLRGYLLTSNNHYVERLEAHRAAMRSHLEQLRQLVSAPEHIALIDNASGFADAWWTEVAEESRRLMSDPTQRSRVFQLIGPNGVADQYMDRVEGALDAMDEAASAAISKARADADAAVQFNEIVLVVGLVSAVLVSIALGFALSRMIATPVTALTNVMGRLAAGENEVEVPSTSRRDEIGQMANAVLVFKQAALDKIRLEAQAAEERSTNERHRNMSEAEKAREAEEDHQAITGLAKALSSLADGNLTYRISQEFAPKTQQLKDDFNRTAEQLEQAMMMINGAIEGMRSGTSEISQAADDLSRRTEQQAASLEETAAALDQITATVRKTAEGAREASQVTGDARIGAEKSGEIVRNAINAMAQIEKSSHQISQIIGVIDEIAFQTNLLALNAGVEAARAGEAGKGFAVVASEVRGLAQRSAEAAKEIKQLISTSSVQVEHGVDLVGQTGEALERIVVQVSQITGLVSEIAASAQEQSTGLAEVNTAVNQMDQVTQQNAAMVEQSTAASHNLAQEAEELARLVARFQLSGSAAVAPAQPKAKAQPVAARPAAPAPRPQAPAPRPQLRTTGTGGAAAALLSQPDEDGWEEF
jgi:methyl-accepting chemotaxis protein